MAAPTTGRARWSASPCPWRSCGPAGAPRPAARTCVAGGPEGGRSSGVLCLPGELHRGVEALRCVVVLDGPGELVRLHRAVARGCPGADAGREVSGAGGERVQRRGRRVGRVVVVA